jgi:hypothetical protein
LLDSQIVAWGPYQIPKELFDDADELLSRFESGRIKWQACDKFNRKSLASLNCVHAVSDCYVSDGFLSTGLRSGIWAAESVARHFQPLFFNPDVVHDDVWNMLELDSFEIERRPLLVKRRPIIPFFSFGLQGLIPRPNLTTERLSSAEPAELAEPAGRQLDRSIETRTPDGSRSRSTSTAAKPIERRSSSAPIDRSVGVRESTEDVVGPRSYAGPLDAEQLANSNESTEAVGSTNAADRSKRPRFRLKENLSEQDSIDRRRSFEIGRNESSARSELDDRTSRLRVPPLDRPALGSFPARVDYSQSVDRSPSKSIATHAEETTAVTSDRRSASYRPRYSPSPASRSSTTINETNDSLSRLGVELLSKKRKPQDSKSSNEESSGAAMRESGSTR